MLRKLSIALLMLPLATPVLADTTKMDYRLTGNEWMITQIGTEAVSADAKLTLAFDPEGRISGHSGCNRYMGGAKQDGMSLEFTQMASTMMACGDAQMKLERSMLDHLSQTKKFALAADGALELHGADGLVLRATRGAATASETAPADGGTGDSNAPKEAPAR